LIDDSPQEVIIW